ncbi:hypothetical protein TRIP_B350168 [uncultured Desulfatiglans sp.]|uniref:Uncharacterized protein n=1 Tax=Uncultured Desulfatiglans sp. TaxID=1748965 RepID=A0A653AAE8_UNCDX|nr:hypothetical protein TRIP_B350168 [uncultured Desulfatiglans sp.]
MVRIKISESLNYPNEEDKAGLKRFLDQFELSNFDSVAAIFVEPITQEEAVEGLLLRIKAFLRKKRKCFRADIIGDSVMIHGDDAFEAIIFGSFLDELSQNSKITKIIIQTEFEPAESREVP